MVKISIIIPVYNVEEYLRKCLESCIGQTFKDIEIIVVNDASPDNCDIIMQEYEKKYPDLIRCIYLKENIKLGGARNRGIEIARGEYLMFVDSDDWIDPEMCEKMYASAMVNDADMVVCNAQIENTPRKVFLHFSECQNDSFDVDKSLIIKTSHTAAWARIIKKEIILSTKLFFPEKVFYEDCSVVYIWVMFCKHINALSSFFYHYFSRNDSIVHSKNNENMLYRLQGYESYALNLQKYNLNKNDFMWIPLIIWIGPVLVDYILNYIGDIDYAFVKFRKVVLRINPSINIIIKENNINNFDKILVYDFFQYDDFFERIKSIINRINYPFCVWGYGKYGKMIVKYLKKKGASPDYIVDENLAVTLDKNPDGIPICLFESIKNKCANYIIAIRDADIVEEIMNRIHLFDDSYNVIHYINLFVADEESLQLYATWREDND